MYEQNPKILLIQKIINARLTKEEMQSITSKAKEILTRRTKEK